jgi:hypothetical protein
LDLCTASEIFHFLKLYVVFFFITDDKEKESSDAKSQEMEETILKRSKLFRKGRHHGKKRD